MTYRFVWCTYRNAKVIKGEFENLLSGKISILAKGLGLTLVSLSLGEHYVSMQVKAPHNVSPHWIVQQFKRVTAGMKDSDYISLVLPTLWTRKYYACTEGSFKEEDAVDFINRQKGVKNGKGKN